MRSIILILAAIVVLAGGFFTYLWFQPAARQTRANRLIATSAMRPPPETLGPAGIGTVNGGWVNRFDRKTGELASRYRGEKSTPQKDGTVLVDRPEAEFFSESGKQRIRIEGLHGSFILPSTVKERKPGELSGKMESPSRGLLYDGVTVSIFEPADEPEPFEVVHVNNASFDNDTFRIATEAYDDAAGRHIEADQAPVQVRGRDYDFDGLGLVIQWNERDRKLQLLEVQHGKSLTIKNPAMLSKATVARAANDGLEEMLVSADRTDGVRLAAAVKKRPRRPATRPSTRRAAARPATRPATRPGIIRDESPTVYRATFLHDVMVKQAGRRLAAAEQMNVFYLQAAQKKPPAATQSVVPLTSDGGVRSDEAAHTSASSKPAAETGLLEQDAAQPTPPKPAEEPMIITWTGKLRVVPVESATQPSLIPGKAAVEMLGAPVLLDREDTHVQCARAWYNGADSSATLTGSDSIPLVKMTDARGSVVQTPQMQYRENGPHDRVATLIGASSADLPVNSAESSNQASKTPPTTQMLHSTWTDQCRLLMSADNRGRTMLQTASLQGAVTVNHPQLDMTSDAMDLTFAPAPESKVKTKSAAAPSDMAEVLLQRMLASGNVHAKMRDQNDKQQTIDSRQLTVDTETSPDGQLYPRKIEADGQVHSVGEKGDLRAEHLQVKLKPSTRPAKSPSTMPTASAGEVSPPSAPDAGPASQPSSNFNSGNVELETLVAEKNVTYTTPQGSKTKSDLLRIEQKSGTQHVRLDGTPAATVTDGKSIVSGKTILFSPDDKVAQVPGPGTLHGIQPGSNDVVDIAWTGGATINGLSNLIDIDQQVIMHTKQADGTLNTSQSNHLQAKLAEKTDTTAPAAKPQEGNFMENKEITQAILTGDVMVSSALSAADGALLRGFDLLAQRVDYDRTTRDLIVPVPGRMRYQDHRPDSESQKEGPTVGSGRGVTAFEWKKSLTYQDAKKQAVLRGDVAIVHRPDNKNGEPFRLDAQTVTADFEPDKSQAAPAPAPATAPAPAGEIGAEKLHLKRLTAEDAVRVVSTRLNFESQELVYDPLTQLMTARGRQGEPGTFIDNNNSSHGVFGELTWNTQTDEFSVKDPNFRMRR